MSFFSSLPDFLKRVVFVSVITILRSALGYNGCWQEKQHLLAAGCANFVHVTDSRFLARAWPRTRD